MSNLDVCGVKEVYLIHSIGPFLFEEAGRPEIDENKDGIDDRVYDVNVVTLLNIAGPLIRKVHEEAKKSPLKLTICAFGSVTDRYLVPWWQSYSKAKNCIREYIRSNVGEHTRGVFINVSTTSTEKEEKLRPFADKTYWLSCKEVVNRSIRAILDENLDWQEIDMFKPNPAYRSDYYFDHKGIREKWLKEIKGV